MFIGTPFGELPTRRVQALMFTRACVVSTRASETRAMISKSEPMAPETVSKQAAISLLIWLAQQSASAERAVAGKAIRSNRHPVQVLSSHVDVKRKDTPERQC